MKAKAGDGLPLIERAVIRYFLIPVVRLLMTWNLALFLLKRERKIIENLTNLLSDEEKEKRVKVDRTFAIEEHSSDYSINMICEHLYITSEVIMEVIDSLSREKEYKKSITIENVKPIGKDKDSIKIFLDFMNKYELFIKEHKKNQSTMTKAHPWFINFNNHDWSCFMFMHTFIHRRQIEEILRVQRLNNE
ncbi:hypothetical protein ACH5BF_10065 [Arcobacter sp. YIC-464]|uniref:hypothetical protein n=1 Tax=Arcobacter sp. YIC-464 TaxID=3376631 RepID=UPI003C1CA9DB